MGRRGQPLTPAEKQRIRDLYRQGYSKAETARMMGCHVNTVTGIIKGLRNSSGDAWREAGEDNAWDEPVPLDELSDEAAKAKDDIQFFALRYFGLILLPFHVEATEAVLELLDTPDEEYLVNNQPPGTGKSTFFTLVLPAWMTVRDRAIRGLIGSAVADSAAWYTGRLRTAFTRRTPVKAKVQDQRAGIAVDAVATLVEDFGRFRPVSGGEDIWRRDAFVVAQHGGVELSEKEPTWSAVGRDSQFLGFRGDLVIWDDVYDPRKMRTAEARQDLKDWWGEYAETRLEPGGLLVLQGQRLGPDDIYRHALDLRAGDVDDALEGVDAEGERPSKYHHIRFRAHYEDRCAGAEGHRKDSAPYPEGCVLYPGRLPFRKLATIRRNTPDKFEVVYQQEDVDPSSVLVPMVWIEGGTDPESGEMLVGCWDRDRGLCQLPRDGEGKINLAGPLLSIATADPSPTKWWAVQWWVVDVASQQRFLMDCERKRMEAPDLLDRLFPSGDFVGIMEDWHVRSVALGLKITHWVVEKNGAQRFMLQYNHTRDWMRTRGVAIIPHETGRNKADPELGVESIAPHYKFGRVRLPGKQHGDPGRLAATRLITEVTKYPEGATDDCVMAHWFLEWNLPKLRRPDRAPAQMAVPSWVNGRRELASR